MVTALPSYELKEEEFKEQVFHLQYAMVVNYFELYLLIIRGSDDRMNYASENSNKMVDKFHYLHYP